MSTTSFGVLKMAAADLIGFGVSVDLVTRPGDVIRGLLVFKNGQHCPGPWPNSFRAGRSPIGESTVHSRREIKA